MTLVSSLPRLCLMLFTTLLLTAGRVQARAVESVVDGLAFSPNGRLLAVSIHKHQKQQAVAQELHLYDVASGRRRWSVAGKIPSPAQVAFSPDGSRIITVAQPRPSAEGRVTVWEVATRRPILELPLERDEQISSMALSPDGNSLILGTTTVKGQEKIGAVKHFDIATGQLRQTVLSLEATPRFLTFSSDGATLVGVMALADKLAVKATEVIFWDTADYSVKQRISLGDVVTHHVTFSADLKKAALTSNKIEVTEMALVLWDLETQAFVRTPLPVSSRERITALHFTPTQKQLVVAGSRLADKQEYIWIVDTATGALLRELSLGSMNNAQTSPPTSALHPAGQTFAIAVESDSVELRSLEDGILIRVFE